MKDDNLIDPISELYNSDVFVDIDSIDEDSISEDPFDLDSNNLIEENYLRDMIAKEYREMYSEKTNQAICALLNSGGGCYSLSLDLEVIVRQLKKDIKKQFPSFDDKRSIKKREWFNIVNDMLCTLIFENKLIHRELLKRLWTSSIEDDRVKQSGPLELQDILDKSLGQSLGRNCCDTFVGGTSFEVKLSVEKPDLVGLFFFLRRKKRRLSYKGKEIGEKTSQMYHDEYYFYFGEKIVKTSETHLRYFELLSRNPRLPIIKEYEPAKLEAKKEFIEIKDNNNVDFEIIGELNSSNALYKYMDLESALLCLERKVKGKKVEKEPNIRFVEPTSWDDQYEGRFYNACYKQEDKNGNIVDVDSKETPFLYACCFSSKRENEAAWVLYSHNRTGLASRCVEFKLNRVKLREQLVKNLEDCSIYIGPVQYLNKELIDHVHEKVIGQNRVPNKDYDMYFRPFMKECYLNLLLIKRAVFEHEKEVRVFIVPNDEIRKEKTRRGKDGKFSENVKPKSKYVDFDWTEVIEEVRIDKNCTEYEIELFQDRLNKLAQLKKKEKGLSKKAYDELILRFKLKTFNPYKDELLANGPLTIITNQ